MTLFLTQNLLVAAKQTQVHRRLGRFGAVLAALLVGVGVLTSLIRASERVALSGSTAPLRFLAVSLGDMLLFTGFVAAGFHFRRRPDVHKRLMLFATVVILDAAVARWPFAFVKGGPAVFFAVIDLFVLACVFYDLATRRRVHPATLWGGVVIVVSQPLRIVIAGTHAWMIFAQWLTGWLA